MLQPCKPFSNTARIRTSGIFGIAGTTGKAGIAGIGTTVPLSTSRSCPSWTAKNAPHHQRHLDEALDFAAQGRYQRQCGRCHNHRGGADRRKYAERPAGWCQGLPVSFPFKTLGLRTLGDEEEAEDDAENEEEGEAGDGAAETDGEEDEESGDDASERPV